MSLAILRHSYSAAIILSVAAVATAAEQTTAQRFALLVGVNEYDHNKLKSLRFAENDVSALAVVLKSGQYQVTLLTTKANSAELKPTKANIENQLKQILQKCHKGDTVLIAFSGHGLQFEGEPDAFFCPVDARPFKTNTDTLVSIGKVYRELDNSFATMKVVLVDACRDDPAAGRGSSRGVNSSSAPPPPQGIAALYSCGAGEQAFESPKLKHGVFFYHVIEGLKGQAADGDQEVTFASLASYVSRRVRRDVAQIIGDGATQSPNLKADYNLEPVLLSATRGQTVDDLLRADWLEYRRMWALNSPRQFREQNAPKRLADWRLAAESGDARGQALFGTCLIFGVGAQKETTKGMALMHKAAEQGEPMAMVLLGNLLGTGAGGDRDDTEAAKWIRRAAERGLPEGKYQLGILLMEGRGVVKDEAEAVKLFRQTAEHGLANAQDWLGIMLKGGRGAPKDEKEALDWFRKAAAQNCLTAINHVGIAYQFGQGVAKDESEAVAWYRKAAALGLAVAQDNLGAMLQNGLGVEKNEKEALEWFRKSAAQSCAAALNHLGRSYSLGLGVEKDAAEGVKWYRKAAEMGLAMAQDNLGHMLAGGVGTARDDVEAVTWFRKAVAQNFVNAKNNLGTMYENGRGVAKDEAEAVRLFREAADGGSMYGQWNLGRMYESGRGVTADRDEAIKWYRKAAAQRHSGAKEALTRLGVTL